MSLIDMKWYALQVQPRCESRVSQTLSMKGYEVFSPTYSRRQNQNGRLIQKHTPLFPTYLFCQYNSTIRQRMVDSPGVVRIVGFGNSPVPIDDAEINSIQTLYQSGVRAQPWQFIDDGARVRVVNGALKGVEGIFVQSKGAKRVIVNITLLYRSLMVEIDGADIEVLTNPARKITPARAPVGKYLRTQ